jgi:S-adenosylmethionine hydrolase
LRLAPPQPQRTAGGWSAQVIHVDHFGNLGINLRRDQLDPTQAIGIRIKETEIQGIVQAYGERTPGDLVALFDSGDLLSIAIVNGNAAQLLQAKIGDLVEITISPA